MDELLQRCTVKLSIPGKGGWGTGFLVAPGWILTCAHVVRDAGNVVGVRWQQQEAFAEAMVEKQFPELDVALLRFDEALSEDLPCVMLEDGVEVGDELSLFGYPDEDFSNGCPVTLTCEGLTGDEPPFIKLKSGQIRSGMSGAALLNRRTGKVCGMLKFTRNQAFDLGGGGVLARVVLQQLPELVAWQRDFHAKDRRWRDCIEGLVKPEPAVIRWRIPSPNPHFTGREAALERLHRELRVEHRAAIGQAIAGLGGIGKTQTAIEYAHRYQDDYKAMFWVIAGEEFALRSDFADLAQALNLPQKDWPELDERVKAVQRWLGQNEGWLLIFDSADNPEWIKPLIPRDAKGRILLTSRARNFQGLGIVQAVELEKWQPLEAFKFLLLRTGRAEGDEREHFAAAELAAEVDYLPLALEQAAAYIVAKQVRFRDYLQSYRKRRLALLEREMPQLGDYPASVATTWALNFQEVEKNSLAAAELLQFSAFVGSDRIPYELLSLGLKKRASEVEPFWEKGLRMLGFQRPRQTEPTLGEVLAQAEDDPLVIPELLEQLTRYSLVSVKVEEQCYSLHKLVQEVTRDRLDEETRGRWKERSLAAMNKVFPNPEFENWSLCERLLTHAEVVVVGVEDSLVLARLLNQMGYYLHEQAQYEQAESLYERALRIFEQQLGAEHPLVATSLNNLAGLYSTYGMYWGVETFYLRALEIRERQLGANHPHVAATLTSLAAFYNKRGRYAEAEPLLVRALAIFEQVLGVNHPHVAGSLNNLAELYRLQERYEEAESLHRRALAIREQKLEANHPDVAHSLNSLALIYYAQGRYREAEPLYERALAIFEQVLGANHPDVATSLNNLAQLYEAQERYGEAESLYRRAIEICEQVLGVNHASVFSLSNLAKLYKSQERYSEAESLYLKAIEILALVLPEDHPDTEVVWGNFYVFLQKVVEKKQTAVLSNNEITQEVLALVSKE